MSTATPDWCEVLRCGTHQERAAIRSASASVPHPDYASRRNSANRDFIFLRNASMG